MKTNPIVKAFDISKNIVSIQDQVKGREKLSKENKRTRVKA
jgi:hypothetical protein